MGTIKDKLKTALASKDAIKAALIAKGVENVDDVMSHYAGFIDAIQAGGLDFSKIGYTPQYLVDALAYAEEIKENWGKRGWLLDRKRLVIFPVVEIGSAWLYNMFSNSNILFFPKIDVGTNIGYAFQWSPIIYVDIICPKITNIGNTFGGCDRLQTLILTDSYNITTYDRALSGLRRLEKFKASFRSVEGSNVLFDYCEELRSVTITEIGNNPNLTSISFNCLNWGDGSPENLQSLKDTFSHKDGFLYNRKAAGMSVVTITLKPSVKDRLSQEEIQGILDYGYTLA